MMHQRQAAASMTSVQIHCTARNLTSDASDGKSMLNTTISYRVSRRSAQQDTFIYKKKHTDSI